MNPLKQYAVWSLPLFPHHKRLSLRAAWIIVLPLCFISSNPQPVFAVPLEGRIGVLGLPASPSSIGAEIDLGYSDIPMSLGLQAAATIPSPPYPSHLSVLGRSTPVFPSDTPAFGILGGVTLMSTTGSPGGTRWSTSSFLGAIYQQAWGPIWLRIAPNTSIPYDLPLMLTAGPPWLEVGYRIGVVELSLRSSLLPLKVAARF